MSEKVIVIKEPAATEKSLQISFKEAAIRCWAFWMTMGASV